MTPRDSSKFVNCDSDFPFSYMPTGNGAPQLGGKLAVALFVATLLAFVSESQFTQVSVFRAFVTSPKR